MSYEPTNWKDGDLVTSAKLNKMEQGIAAGGSGGITFVELDYETGALNKTWQEIYNAAQDGIVYVKNVVQDKSISIVTLCPVIGVTHTGGNYLVHCLIEDVDPAIIHLTAESPDDYPVWQESGSESGSEEPNPEL